jgi:hypothetical protein
MKSNAGPPLALMVPSIADKLLKEGFCCLMVRFEKGVKGRFIGVSVNVLAVDELLYRGY